MASGSAECSTYRHFHTVPPSIIPRTSAPGCQGWLLKIFLLGTRAHYSLGDVNVPELMAIQQKAHEAVRGNLTHQPPDFPSRAVLGAFPGFVNWREVMFPQPSPRPEFRPYLPLSSSADAFIWGKHEVRGILLNPARRLFSPPFPPPHLEKAEGEAMGLVLQFASYCFAVFVPTKHKFFSPS